MVAENLADIDRKNIVLMIIDLISGHSCTTLDSNINSNGLINLRMFCQIALLSQGTIKLRKISRNIYKHK
jgi:hypothetical protein